MARQFISILVFFLLYHVSVHCAVMFGLQDPVPGKEGKCYNDDQSEFFGEGVSYYPKGKCLRYYCSREEEGKMLLQIHSCGKFGVDPPCYLDEGDLQLTYPECCPTPHCPGAKPEIEPK